MSQVHRSCGALQRREQQTGRYEVARPQFQVAEMRPWDAEVGQEAPAGRTGWPQRRIRIHNGRPEEPAGCWHLSGSGGGSDLGS